MCPDGSEAFSPTSSLTSGRALSNYHSGHFLILQVWSSIVSEILCRQFKWLYERNTTELWEKVYTVRSIINSEWHVPSGLGGVMDGRMPQATMGQAPS